MSEFPSLPGGSRTNIEFSSEILRLIALYESQIFGGKNEPISDICGLNPLSLEDLKNLHAYSRYISDEEIHQIMNTKNSLLGASRIIEAIWRVKLAIKTFN